MQTRTQQRASVSSELQSVPALEISGRCNSYAHRSDALADRQFRKRTATIDKRLATTRRHISHSHTRTADFSHAPRISQSHRGFLTRAAHSSVGSAHFSLGSAHSASSPPLFAG